MNLDIHVDMTEEALIPFRSAWREAQQRSAEKHADQLLIQAREHHAAIGSGPVAPFLRGHLDAVGEAIDLLDDHRWQADPHLRQALLGALAYFVDPTDLIPDGQSQFGLLDDAIVLELAIATHREEWQAWREFAQFRRSYPDYADLDRDQWTQLRRDEVSQVLRHRYRQTRGDRRYYAHSEDLTPFLVH